MCVCFFLKMVRSLDFYVQWDKFYNKCSKFSFNVRVVCKSCNKPSETNSGQPYHTDSRNKTMKE